MKRFVVLVVLMACLWWAAPSYADVYRIASAVDGSVGVQINFNGSTKEVQNILVFQKGKPPAVNPTYVIKNQMGMVIASGMIGNGNTQIPVPAGIYFMMPDVEKPYLYVSPFIIELNVPYGN